MDGRNTANFQQLHEQVVGDGTQDVKVVLGKLFMLLLFKSKLVGTAYLKEAVLYRYEQELNAQVSLTKEIYPAVASRLSTTVNRVERNIRNAISDCHEHGNLYAFNVLTRGDVIKTGYAPTNGELISSIASWLQLERQQNNIQ